MSYCQALLDKLQARFGEQIVEAIIAYGELTITIVPENLKAVCQLLRDDTMLDFKQLIDVCGVDYLEFGKAEWITEKATACGFERATLRTHKINVLKRHGPRFAVIYHLLSLSQNQRLCIKVYVKDDLLMVPSLVDIWPSANWPERETYDLYGILFEGHPDLRRILTDYGFNGHPFRKDFPLSGYVEMRYDAKEQRVVYDKVDIEPRVLVPKVIRKDNRYVNPEPPEGTR